jgi:DNA-binding NarL/FixJ family response regulator
MDPTSIRILIAEDHELVRHGLVQLIGLAHDLNVVGEAADGRTAIAMALQLQPDVILMDLGMPEVTGLEATRQLKKKAPGIRILILSGYDADVYVGDAFEAGADGYILKTARLEELVAAVKAVDRGERYVGSGVSAPPGIAVEGVMEGRTTRLTEREREILQLIAEGRTHNQIAASLFISARTVDVHRNNIMKKLDLHDAASLVRYAIANGIVLLPPSPSAQK